MLLVARVEARAPSVLLDQQVYFVVVEVEAVVARPARASAAPAVGGLYLQEEAAAEAACPAMRRRGSVYLKLVDRGSTEDRPTPAAVELDHLPAPRVRQEVMVVQV